MTEHDQMPLLIQADARQLPLPDESVDLVVTSPPYYSLRSYSDSGEQYSGQIGLEPTPDEYLTDLIDCTREMVRVLKPTGSIWVNLGDKYVSDNRGSGADVKRGRAKYAPVGPPGFPGSDFARKKSLMLLPQRYVIKCSDDLGLIIRQDQVWNKTNGLPESVTDRTRRSHEYLFHMVKNPHYYSAVDVIREPHVYPDDTRHLRGVRRSISPIGEPGGNTSTCNPLGKLPGSVWSIPSQPLNVPDHISHTQCCDGQKRDGCENGLDHYAAFPYALVRPVILGWSPRDVCTGCGEGRRPVSMRERPTVERSRAPVGGTNSFTRALGAKSGLKTNASAGEYPPLTITGSVCACADVTSPTTAGVVLDPFGGTASTALVAAMNGRTGISIDASWDYNDIIARWRIRDLKERARAAGLDSDAVSRVGAVGPQQRSLFEVTW